MDTLEVKMMISCLLPDLPVGQQRIAVMPDCYGTDLHRADDADPSWFDSIIWEAQPSRITRQSHEVRFG